MAAKGPVVFKIDWRRGPRELKASLMETRHRVIREMAEQMRERAPTDSIKAAIRHSDTPAQIRIDHPAARFWETGVERHMPPVSAIIPWALSIGKTIREAYAVARAGVSLPRRPYIQPAVKRVMKTVPKRFRDIWEGGR